MQNWSFEQDTEGRSVIKHHAPPRFIAKWTSGTAKEAVPLGSYWLDENSKDGDDHLYLFGFEWIDPQPEAVAFERLMQNAAKVIDEWIVSNL